jgi:hypothetical protein
MNPEKCEECHQPILYGQAVCRLLNKTFHGPCLIQWCQRKMVKRDASELRQ